MSIEFTEAPLRERLRAALPVAMKARDRDAASALRSALAAIDNSEAVDAAEVKAGAIEASAVGLGAAEARRRELTEADIERIVQREIDERRSAAEEYESLGRSDRADRLRAEAAALAAHLPTK
ncbi:GatB/YqeY domain-containing protein [Nocardia transvalensis]|uniref:GatB/YqeY domain-containing protein n=1 Tax=Nocardia transvalensis TaxID=37333 RepID=UPI0018948684|nr:GatB/YqeY domain-containing protein [Nocardia transvalensis]MBF6329362.1 GatB/YqeY domain-containing protein [Nocardia transvalensis]